MIILLINETTKSENNIDDNKKITDEQRADFDRAFYGLNEEKLWTLNLDALLREYARNLEYESYLHSFIINDVDKKTNGKRYLTQTAK